MKDIRLRLIESKSYNPWYNLSLEEYLLDNVKNNEIILYLWQNDNTVVIGRNQNAWKECAWQQLADDGGRLARRLSGGGAVYHDLGNLNFTFIMCQEHYAIEKHHRVIMEALAEFDVKAEFSGRNDMLIDGKKFSGHAYYTNKNKMYHHGTLMVNSDLEKLGYYLKPSEKKIKSKGIDSIRSRVINITDANSFVTVDGLKRSLKESFCKIYEGECTSEVYEMHMESIIKLYEKYSSWEWRFGQSPEFDIAYSERFPWGEVEFLFTLKNGKIVKSAVYTDAMDTELFAGLSKGFIGCSLQKSEIKKAVEKHLTKEKERNDILEWLESADI